MYGFKKEGAKVQKHLAQCERLEQWSFPPPYGGKVHEAGARVQKTDTELRKQLVWLSMPLGPAKIHAGPTFLQGPENTQAITGTSPTFFAPPGPEKKSGQVQKTCTGPKKGCPGPKNMHPKGKAGSAIFLYLSGMVVPSSVGGRARKKIKYRD